MWSFEFRDIWNVFGAARSREQRMMFLMKTCLYSAIVFCLIVISHLPVLLNCLTSEFFRNRWVAIINMSDIFFFFFLCFYLSTRYPLLLLWLVLFLADINLFINLSTKHRMVFKLFIMLSFRCAPRKQFFRLS